MPDEVVYPRRQDEPTFTEVSEYGDPIQSPREGGPSPVPDTNRDMEIERLTRLLTEERARNSPITAETTDPSPGHLVDRGHRDQEPVYTRLGGTVGGQDLLSCDLCGALTAAMLAARHTAHHSHFASISHRLGVSG